MARLFTQFAHNVLPSSVGVSPTQSVDNVPLDSSTDTITATASGTQTTAVLLTTKVNRITVVASGSDAVRLPPALAGVSIVVSNAATNSAAVFPSSATQGGVTGGDAINALSQNSAYTLATGRQTFICFTTGTWETA
jgi:hypothetical protein